LKVLRAGGLPFFAKASRRCNDLAAVVMVAAAAAAAVVVVVVVVGVIIEVSSDNSK